MRTIFVAVLCASCLFGSRAQADEYCPFNYAGFFNGVHYFFCHVGPACNSATGYATVSSPRMHVLGCTYSGMTSTCIDKITTGGEPLPHLDLFPNLHKTFVGPRLDNKPLGVGDDLLNLGSRMPVATFCPGSPNMRVRSDFVMAEMPADEVLKRYRVMVVHYDVPRPNSLLLVIGQEMVKDGPFDVVGVRQDEGGIPIERFKIARAIVAAPNNPIVPLDIQDLFGDDLVVNTLAKAP